MQIARYSHETVAQSTRERVHSMGAELSELRRTAHPAWFGDHTSYICHESEMSRLILPPYEMLRPGWRQISDHPLSSRSVDREYLQPYCFGHRPPSGEVIGTSVRREQQVRSSARKAPSTVSQARRLGSPPDRQGHPKDSGPYGDCSCRDRTLDIETISNDFKRPQGGRTRIKELKLLISWLLRPPRK